MPQFHPRTLPQSACPEPRDALGTYPAAPPAPFGAADHSGARCTRLLAIVVLILVVELVVIVVIRVTVASHYGLLEVFLIVVILIR
ncbi:hypothetical protein FB461_1031 [Rarobacter faecitabidus]|uniref:Flagellin-like protein n=1 Tax=Rarobacter faecitabidus TaxID=13243 RepID=A0A542ZW98_RARFA|nr:hypothetical protein FB461_1031 [Rarobacter faecitabidus]